MGPLQHTGNHRDCSLTLQKAEFKCAAAAAALKAASSIPPSLLLGCRIREAYVYEFLILRSKMY